MSKNLKFLLWPAEGAPILAESGAASNFSDGLTIELFTDAQAFVQSNNFQFADVQFTLTLSSQNNLLAEHTFQMENMFGKNIWLIANPSMTDPNGSFTAAFIKALCDLGAGDHLVSVKLDATANQSTTTINSGEITFKHNGSNSEYQQLIPLFADANAVRNTANDATQKAYDDAREKEATEKHNARKFNVFLNNTHSYKTIYIVQEDHKTLSQQVKEVLAGKTLTLELSRNMTYNLLFYRQDENIADALKFAVVDEASEGSKMSIS